MTQSFGWIPEADMTKPQAVTHNEIRDQMPKFALQGEVKQIASGDRFPLWRAAQTLWGRFHAYVWQTTGSCVGAGGGNALITIMAVEQLMASDPDEFQMIWWPYTYGESREIAGMRGQGEGCFGSAWAKAILKEGVIRADESGLPQYKDRSGWLSLDSRTELIWSDGEAIDKKWNEIGRKHIVKTMAPITSTQQAAEAIANGYPITIACMFGTNTIRKRGNPPVNIAEYDARWPHQQSMDEVWHHPELGRIYRINNQWGPNAHPAPVSGEPPGGYYILESTLARILRERDCECYAMSQFEGFPAQKVDWTNIWGPTPNPPAPANTKQVIMFSSTGCGACEDWKSRELQRLRDHGVDAGHGEKSQLRILDYTKSEDQPLFHEYGVNRFPTFIFFDDGQRKDTHVGSTLSGKRIEDWVK